MTLCTDPHPGRVADEAWRRPSISHSIPPSASAPRPDAGGRAGDPLTCSCAHPVRPALQGAERPCRPPSGDAVGRPDEPPSPPPADSRSAGQASPSSHARRVSPSMARWGQIRRGVTGRACVTRGCRRHRVSRSVEATGRRQNGASRTRGREVGARHRGPPSSGRREVRASRTKEVSTRGRKAVGASVCTRFEARFGTRFGAGSRGRGSWASGPMVASVR